MEFPYVRIENAFRPMLPVTLRMEDRMVDAEALVDSGSDRNIFDAGYARILGMEDLADGGIETPVYGVTGEPRTGYAHDVVVQFGDYSMLTSVIFLPDMPDQCKAILGQEGFFDVGTVKFHYRQGFFEIAVHESRGRPTAPQ